MNSGIECLSCFIRQAVEAVAFGVSNEERREAILRGLLAELAAADWRTTPVAVGQRLHRAIRQATGVADPYGAPKDSMNRLALDMLPSLRMEARLAEDSRVALVRLAVAGNLMDAGAKTGITEQNMREALCRASREPLYGSAKNLFDAATRARRILFLADNAGEIVFDRALIEVLPTAKITVAVRGAPVLNDATLADARVAGLIERTTVISNGSDAPGTILEDCSEEFRRAFADSDLIVAKGQGNFESLSDTAKHVFFLLRVKCPLVAAQTGGAVWDMVVCERNPEAR